ncbi:MAG: DNA/RNA nuclease SfsA [Deltaproteobacteria bacterium]|nr:DNA/RNA nuclease SfsA [Deltaproteobacteria bacterium]
MIFPGPLIPARFLQRRQRFLAEAEFADGRREWVHVPNSGALTGCLTPGLEILLTRENRPGRKTAYTWRFCKGPAGWICIDTLAPNRLVAEALAGPGLPGLPPPIAVRPEVVLPQGSRLDFVLEYDQSPAVFVEVKSVTWVEEGVALFPDGVTSRGRRHLEHLEALAAQGFGAWQVFVVQREDARAFDAAATVDPAYARELARAARNGVQILVIQEKINPPEITLASCLPFDLIFLR